MTRHPIRVLRVVELSGADGVRVESVVEPPGNGDVVIDVHAIGIGYSTLLRSMGKYQERSEPPYILDGETAGVVMSAPASSGLRSGDRVAAPAAHSFAAERVALPAASVLPLPAHLSMAQAACLRNFETALFALEQRGRARSGEVVLVHGAGGGSGVAAIEVARSIGCRVFAVVSSSAKADIARAASADEVLLADREWRAEAVRLTDGRGVDVVFDPVGGDAMLLDTMRCLAEGGRWIIFGFTAGIQQIPANRLLLRNIEAVGAYRSSFFKNHPEALRSIDSRLVDLLERRRLNPLPGSAFRFEDGAEALRSIASRESVGQVVLEITR